MKKCRNCKHDIRKINGQKGYEHTITPTGRSNNTWGSHFLDIGCRCDNPEHQICYNCGQEKISHIDYFDTGKKNVCPHRKSMKFVLAEEKDEK